MIDATHIEAWGWRQNAWGEWHKGVKAVLPNDEIMVFVRLHPVGEQFLPVLNDRTVGLEPLPLQAAKDAADCLLMRMGQAILNNGATDYGSPFPAQAV